MANELSGNALRFTFLETVYEVTGGDPMEMIHLDQICERIGMDRGRSELAMRWLVDEKLLKYATFGPTLSIEHQGVRIVEAAREHPDQAIPPFPSYNEIFRQAEAGSLDVGGEQREEPVRQKSDASLNSSEADRADVADEPVLDPELDEREPEARTASVSEDVPLQERVSISPKANPDVVARNDRLGFKPYVEAVAAFLLSPDTHPPLTLSIEGEWGKGKSSFMTQLLDRIQQDNSTESLCVELHPWLYSKDEELWSSFTMKFIQQASKRLSLSQKCIARLMLLLKRLWRPENRSGLVRGIALVVGYIATMCVVLLALRYAGPGWIDAVASLAGPAAKVVAKWLQVGGWVAVGSTALVLAVIVWPYVKRVLTIDVRSYLLAPNYASRVPFVVRFHEDFNAILETYAAGRRVFVFVDDVDRCEPPRAADLMRAINLLILRNRQMVFILGIDRATVAAGIAATYGDLLPYLAVDEHLEADVEPGTERAAACAGLEFGRGFVEKFVQIPFAVPTPARVDLEKYIRHLGEETGESELGGDRSLEERTAGETHAAENQGELEERFEALMVQVDKADSPQIQRIALMVSGALGRNPRRLKQFLNLFRLRVFIGRATGLFDEMAGTKMWSLPQLGKLVALELQEPTLIARLDRNPELLTLLEDGAILDDKTSDGIPAALSRWLARPQIKELLRLGCVEDEWMAAFPSRQCSFRDLDLSRALRTAPRIRGFPEPALEQRIVRKHLVANVAVSPSMQAHVERKNVSDEGRGHDSVSVERFEAPQSDLASAEEGGETTQMRRQGIPIVGYRGSPSFARRVLPPTRRAELWEIVALIPAVGTDFEEVVGRYTDEKRAVEVFSQFEVWNLNRERNPSSRVRPFHFPSS